MNKKIITIISISIFSIVLWGSISLSEDYSLFLTLPIEFIELSDDYSINTAQLKSVSMRVGGDGWSLVGLYIEGDLRFYIRPQNEVGRQLISLRTAIEQNEWAKDLQVLDVLPNVIEFDVEQISFKRVPIEADYSLDFKSSYGIISEVRIDPDSVDISGPLSRIKLIEAVKTKKREFKNIDKKVTAQLVLEPIESIKYYYDATLLEFDVQKIVDKTFDDVTVEVRGVPSTKQLDLFPPKIKIVLRGGINVLGKLVVEDLKPYVTFDQALSDTLGAIQPIIEVPEFTEVIITKPSKLDYIIKQY